MPTNFIVPGEWLTLANKLEDVAACVRDYVLLPSAPWPDSPRAREVAQENDFAALPFAHPMAEVQTAALHALSSSADHLTAFAAITRTPQTVFALLTVLRTQLVGASLASYLSDPAVDVRERVRRVMNSELQARTEQMRLLVGGGSVLRHSEFERLNSSRHQITDAARVLGYLVGSPPRVNTRGWPNDCWIGGKGDEPPGDAELVSLVMDGAQASPGQSLGRTTYRYLCATAHVQRHGLLGFISTNQSSATEEDGVVSTAITLDGSRLILFAAMAVGALTMAMRHCCAHYGWSPRRWARISLPLLEELQPQL